MKDEHQRARIIEAMGKVPPDILTVIDARGLRYSETQDLKVPSAIVIPKSGDQRPIIEVRANDTPQSKAFSAAYELVRWLLGQERILQQSKTRKSPGGSQKPVRHDTAPFETRGDTDASTGLSTARLNRMAGEILVPKESLSRVLGENGNDIAATARAFRTSEDLVMLRMKALRVG